MNRHCKTTAEVDNSARAEPWLGTLVHIRAQHPDACQRMAALSAAFAVIARVHELMSVHDPASELSRINRLAHLQRQSLSDATRAVLNFALELAVHSGGLFDPSIGALLSQHGILPKHVWPEPAPASGCWRDIDLDQHGVYFHRPLSLDFGGIAKGFAVDQALTVLKDAGCSSAMVNAGGDLACFGDTPELIHIRGPGACYLPALRLAQGAVATSYYDSSENAVHSALIDPLRGESMRSGDCASVCALSCMHADALTKLVLLQAEQASELLRHYGATALLIRQAGDQLHTTYLPSNPVSSAATRPAPLYSGSH